MIRVLFKAYQEFNKDDGPALAGFIAFSTILGLFPFIILSTNIAAMTFGAERSQEAVDALFNYAPEHVAKTLEPVLLDVLRGAGGSLLTVSGIAALWISSNAVEALRKAFDRAYKVESPRRWWKGRLISFGVVIVGVFVFMILGLTIVLGPLIMRLIETYLGFTVPNGVGLIRYLLGFTLFVGFLLFLHRILPRHSYSIKRLWVGVVVSTLIWILAASIFSIYLGYTPSYVSTYGTLAGVIITLVFLYITGMAIIYGAEVNAVLAKGRMTE